MKRLLLLIIFSCLIACAMAHNYYVVNANATGLGSLSAAIDSTNGVTGNDSIIFNLGTSDTIFINGIHNLFGSNVVLWAPPCQNVTISGVPVNGFTSIGNANNSLVLINLTITHMFGGAVSGLGNITLYNCLFDGDSSLVYSFGDNGSAAAITCDTLWAYNCTFKNNVARSNHHAFFGTYGGAVAPNYGYFYNCTFDSNSTDGVGSAICTMAGEIYNCTFVNNWVDSVETNPAEGGVIAGVGPNPQFTIANSIFWNNNKTARRQTMNFSYSSVISGGCNILPVPAGDTGFVLAPSDIVGIDPQLDTLGYYGGCMLTFGIKRGSIAIDDARCNGFTTTDAEGQQQKGWRDAGALEQGLKIGPDVTDTISAGQTVDLTTVYFTTGAIVNYYGHFTDSSKVDTGVYIIIAKSIAGCTDTAIVTVVYAPDTSVINSARDLHTDNTLQVYPNPAKGYVIVDAVNGGNFQIADLNGRIILTQVLATGATKIETSSLQQGVYFLRFSTLQFSEVRKLVIQ